MEYELYLEVIKHLKDEEVPEWIDCYLHEGEVYYTKKLYDMIERIIDRMEY